MSKLIFNDLLQLKDGLIKGPFGGDIKKSLFGNKSENTYKVYEQNTVLRKNPEIGNYKKNLLAVDPVLEACDNSLDNLSKIPIGELAKIPGIGVCKASVIIAAFELSKRLHAERTIPKVAIKSSLDIFDYMSPIYSDLQYEEFWILYLNHGHRIIHTV